jgi:hypothetical protein
MSAGPRVKSVKWLAWAVAALAASVVERLWKSVIPADLIQIEAAVIPDGSGKLIVAGGLKVVPDGRNS